jgi:hypothetical protein
MNSSTKSKKILIWLISTIAAAIIGYFVVHLIEKKPKLDSVLFITTEKVGNEYISKYKLEIRNIGDISITDLRGKVVLFGGATIRSVSVNHYDTDIMRLNYNVPEIGTQIIEFTCDLLEPSKWSPLTVSFSSPALTGVELILLAEGLQYRCYFRDYEQAVSSGDCQLSLEK